MERYYTPEAATERIPEVRQLLLVLRDQRRDLVRLRAQLRDFDDQEPSADWATPGPRSSDARTTAPEDAPASTGLGEAGLIALRIRGIVDQMGAAVARLDRWSIALRDIEAGLIDFPALIDGKDAWLCWKLGEGDTVEHWHPYDTGIAGRRPLTPGLGLTGDGDEGRPDA